MTRVTFALLAIILVAGTAPTGAQMTYRLKGTVTDEGGKPVAGVRVRAEALTGFRGEQFVGQKEFATTTGADGQWTILGLTSGLWAFEATATDTVPHVVVLPINFTNRKPQSAAGGSFSWSLPLRVQRSANASLTTAGAAAMAGRTSDAMAALGSLAAEKDVPVLCSAGEVALLLRQPDLSRAIFKEAVTRDAQSGCGVRGLASAALMQNDFDTAAKMMWTAIDLLPREQRAAYGAAVKDLQQITSTK